MPDPASMNLRRWWFPAALMACAAASGLNTLLTVLDGPYQASLGVSYPILLRAGSAAAWCAVLAWYAVRVARRLPGAGRRGALTVTLYGAWGILWPLVFARSDAGRSRIAFQLAATVLLLIPVWWVHLRR